MVFRLGTRDDDPVTRGAAEEPRPLPRDADLVTGGTVVEPRPPRDEPRPRADPPCDAAPAPDAAGPGEEPGGDAPAPGPRGLIECNVCMCVCGGITLLGFRAC